MTSVPRTQTETSVEEGSSAQASGPSKETTNESLLDVSLDPFASYFETALNADASSAPKVLITTSAKATKTTFEFCDELVNVIPGAEFIRRKKGKNFEMGNIAYWASKRNYTNLIVVNEDMKRPSMCIDRLSSLLRAHYLMYMRRCNYFYSPPPRAFSLF